MLGSLLSVLLMGTVPVWGVQEHAYPLSRDLGVAPPSTVTAQLLSLGTSSGARLTASGVIVVDLESGQTVFAHNANVARPMASLTKLMTALLIVEGNDLSEIVTIPKAATEVEGNVVYLKAGEHYTVSDLLSALLIPSANDAAMALAIHHSGSVEAFAEEMNDRAQALGLAHTSFHNPAGLDAATHRSTPQDLAWLAMYVMRIPDIAQRMGTPSAQIQSREGTVSNLTHTHALLRTDEKEILAGKTGTTDGAGQCLLSIFTAQGRSYIAVLLHSHDRYADMRTVLSSLTH